MFFVPAMNSGGAERVISVITKELAEENDIVILTLNTTRSFYPLSDKVRIRGLGLTTDGMGKLHRLLSIPALEVRRIKEAERAIKEEKPDVIISFLYTTNFISAYLHGKNRIPLIISERNDPTKYGKFKQMICKWTARRADAVVCQSEFVKEYYAESCSKCVVIPNPIDLDSVYTGEPVLKRTKEIIAIGRLVEQKDFETLIKGFYLSELKDNGYNVIIYGKGPLKYELQSLIKNLEMEDAVILAGEKHHIFKEKYDAAMYVMTSIYEGFPNSLLEALISQMPVICTDFSTGVAREYITNKVNGYLIPCGDSQQLAVVLNLIASHEEIGMTIGLDNRNLISQLEASEISKRWVDMAHSVV